MRTWQDCHADLHCQRKFAMSLKCARASMSDSIYVATLAGRTRWDGQELKVWVGPDLTLHLRAGPDYGARGSGAGRTRHNLALAG